MRNLVCWLGKMQQTILLVARKQFAVNLISSRILKLENTSYKILNLFKLKTLQP